MHDVASAAMPIVRLDGTRVLANSRDVAALFGKRHDNVLDAINKLIVSEADLGRLNFKATSYLN